MSAPIVFEVTIYAGPEGIAVREICARLDLPLVAEGRRVELRAPLNLVVKPGQVYKHWMSVGNRVLKTWNVHVKGDDSEDGVDSTFKWVPEEVAAGRK